MARAKNPVKYQAVCTKLCGDTVVYGLQCLEARQGHWVRVDVIEDISTRQDPVLEMAERFNALALSPLHFRDVVMDRVAFL